MGYIAGFIVVSFGVLLIVSFAVWLIWCMYHDYKTRHLKGGEKPLWELALDYQYLKKRVDKIEEEVYKDKEKAE